MNFKELGLIEPILRALDTQGYKQPTPIQEQAIPILLKKKDLLGCAQTGTGKTAAFTLPIIQHLHAEVDQNQRRQVKALVITPTRELALQIEENVAAYARHTKLRHAVIFGGVKQGAQTRRLAQGVDILVATPGRLLDLIGQGFITLKHIKYFVLDEADQMLDMGFIHDIKAILGNLPKKRHTLFFSATMDERTKGIVNDFMNNPVTISVKKKDVTDSIAQDVVRHGRDDKYDTLVNLLQKDAFKRVIVFGAMKHRVQKLGDALNQSGISAESIHGNKSHGQRQRSLKRFKTGEARVLVATDVAARGIHVDNVTHVINYDLPTCFEDYVHRIGRTGRGSRHGEALTFVAQ